MPWVEITFEIHTSSLVLTWKASGCSDQPVSYLTPLISNPLGNNQEIITILVGQKTSCWQIALVFHSWSTACGPFSYLLEMKAEDPPKVRTSFVSSHDLKSASQPCQHPPVSHHSFSPSLRAQLTTPGNLLAFFFFLADLAFGWSHCTFDFRFSLFLYWSCSYMGRRCFNSSTLNHLINGFLWGNVLVFRVQWLVQAPYPELHLRQGRGQRNLGKISIGLYDCEYRMLKRKGGSFDWKRGQARIWFHVPVRKVWGIRK